MRRQLPGAEALDYCGFVDFELDSLIRVNSDDPELLRVLERVADKAQTEDVARVHCSAGGGVADVMPMDPALSIQRIGIAGSPATAAFLMIARVNFGIRHALDPFGFPAFVALVEQSMAWLRLGKDHRFALARHTRIALFSVVVMESSS
jgi:hypothetical protein